MTDRILPGLVLLVVGQIRCTVAWLSCRPCFDGSVVALELSLVPRLDIAPLVRFVSRHAKGCQIDMVHQKCQESDCHDSHQHEQTCLPEEPVKEILRHDKHRSWNLFSCESIDIGNVKEPTLADLRRKQPPQNGTSVGAHTHVHKEEKKEPSIILLADRVVDPATKMIISRNIGIVLVSVKLGPSQLLKARRLAGSIRFKKNIVVWEVVIPVDAPGCYNPRVFGCRKPPARYACDKDERADVLVNV